jgi:drug/metabolite transporter (DMT)-like permease
LYLSVSLIQMMKCLTPVITMIALYLSKLEHPTKKMVMSVVLIALGTCVASFGAVDASLLGMLIMIGAEVAESVRLVMTQYLLVGRKFHPFEGLMYLAPATAFWLALGSLLTEVPRMLHDNALAVVLNTPVKFLAAAVMGFGVNLLAYIVIQSASSLTLKVIGTVKNAIVVLLGVVLLQESIAPVQLVGYGISVAAFYWYQDIKTKQIRQESSSSVAPGTVTTTKE